MKRTLITRLRDKNATIESYRKNTELLGMALACEVEQLLPKKSIQIETPLAEAHGTDYIHDVVLIPILRSGLVMLPPFLKFFPSARIGFLGEKRNEETAAASIYYSSIPSFQREDTLLLLDPMIATGGSACLAVKSLVEGGALETQIILVAFLAAPEGLQHFQDKYPDVRTLVAEIDDGLDAMKRIVPGLGDFGDRYFGTEGQVSKVPT